MLLVLNTLGTLRGGGELVWDLFILFSHQLTTTHHNQKKYHQHRHNSTHICILNFFYYCTHVTKDVHPRRRLQSLIVSLATTEIKEFQLLEKTQLVFLSFN